MSSKINRRRALTLLASGALSSASSAWGQGGAGIGGTGFDSGLGGTGIEAGIGGTGIFGMIEGFSSIWVNDLRIEIPAQAVITLNGRRASEADLALGQTVAVEAYEDAAGTLQAGRIDATFALVGPVAHGIEQNGALVLTVLGQRVVVTDQTELDAISVGDWLIVTGLRDHQGFIQAANIEVTASRTAIVTGPVTADGRVAGVPIAHSLVPLSLGTRATVQGEITNEAEPRLVVTEAVTRPLTIFDPGRLNDVLLSGLPGSEENQLIVDGVAFSLPGLKRSSGGGVSSRVHGRFSLSSRGLRALSGPVSPRQPRAPFAGPNRQGPGQPRPGQPRAGFNQRSQNGFNETMRNQRPSLRGQGNKPVPGGEK